MLILPSDQMLTCPLDEAHRIRKERMQFHLVKCLKNHTLQRKLKCPWNSLHIIDKFAWENHWRHECENMPAALEFICSTEEPKDIASVPIITSRVLIPPSDEDWDAEPCAVGTYDPFKSAEGKLVMRSMVGLSKAKKKQWRLDERKRIQALEANGPLQLKQLHNASQHEKSLNTSGPLRRPHTKSGLDSANASLVEELNASKHSQEADAKSKFKEIAKPRKPYAQSPRLFMEAETLKPKNINEETFSVNDVESVTSEVANLRVQSSDLNSDAASMISTVSHANSRRNDLEKVRQLLERSFVGVTSANETDDDLTERLANLTTMEKSIQDEKTVLLQQMSKFMPKLVNPEMSRASSAIEKESGRAVSNGQVTVFTPMANLTSGKSEKNFAKPIARCAAAFSGPKIAADSSSAGAGRGTIVDFSAFKKRAPGKENAGGNASRSYAQSTSSWDGIGSAFGYEEDDE